MRFETSILIQAPTERVWAVTIAVEQWPEWTASMQEVERLDTGPFIVGSRARIKQPGAPSSEWEVTSMSLGQAFTWESRAPGIHTVATHKLAAQPDGATLVTLSVEMTGWLAKLLWPFLRAITRKFVLMEAEGLQAGCVQ